MYSAYMARLKTWLKTAVCTLGLLGAAACGDHGQDSGDVTDVQHSDVKDQTIGNCWVYASVGWAESLVLRYTGNELDISESYITYWHWFEQITTPAHGERRVSTLKDEEDPELKTGGFWGVAGEVMLRYGMMQEGDFIAADAESIRSSRQRQARSAINASLRNGELSDPEKRSDPTVVRAELDKAWELSEDIVAALDQTFGQDVATTLYDRVAPEGVLITRPADYGVGHLDEGGVQRRITLADAIGGANSSGSWNVRRGDYAWQRTSYPSSASRRRDFQIAVQRALHASQPVLLSWTVDFNAMKVNKFEAPPTSPGRQGGHLVVLEDYQINDVPGHGTLKAGETVLDSATLEAALAPEAKVEFFRIKNSWGEDLAPDNVEELAGYHDLYMTYLDGPITKCHEVDGDSCGRKTQEAPWKNSILPSDRFVTAASGTCDVDSYASNCSGNVLQWCDGGTLERFNCVDGDWVCGMSASEGYGADCVDP